jgi:hypothetical protein
MRSIFDENMLKQSISRRKDERLLAIIQQEIEYAIRPFKSGTMTVRLFQDYEIDFDRHRRIVEIQIKAFPKHMAIVELMGDEGYLLENDEVMARGIGMMAGRQFLNTRIEPESHIHLGEE